MHSNYFYRLKLGSLLKFYFIQCHGIVVSISLLSHTGRPMFENKISAKKRATTTTTATTILFPNIFENKNSECVVGSGQTTAEMHTYSAPLI